MKGDFSKWDSEGKKNFNGVLHQQGRVLLDNDWNDQTRITNDWQDTAAQDTIGPGVAAIPAATPQAFKVIGASVEDDNEIKITLLPGRVWADGLLTYLEGDEEEIELTASYLQTPQILPPESDIRDAVVLEVWREAVNGFQMPDELIEPALGGPDTTERVHTSMALKLLRLGPGDACENVRRTLKDDWSKKGKLAVSLQTTKNTEGDCPLEEGGGYTGFEHYLYRIEIAQIDEAQLIEHGPMYKWSQFNGGLVGRGIFNDGKVQIKANLQPIITSGLTEFYLEALKEKTGRWEVVYGAKVTLNDNNDIVLPELPSTALFGLLPPPDETIFFRLWNGIRKISEFPLHPANLELNELRDGIRLEFETPTEEDDHYVPGDYWTFPVRAGEIIDKEILIGKEIDGTTVGEPPEGIHYHRVPLAELHWSDNAQLEEENIEDCRRIFQPLTKQKGCCSITVGDGISSHGDVDSIQEAVAKLPWWGGEICLLPGLHRAHVSIEQEFNITIRGCGLRTLILPKEDSLVREIFTIKQSSNITVENITLLGANGFKIESSHAVELSNNHMVMFQQAVQAKAGNSFYLHHNQIWMFDNQWGKVAVFSSSDNSVIERNQINVIPVNVAKQEAEDRNIPDGTDDCIPIEEVLEFAAEIVGITLYANVLAWTVENPFRSWGGIQIGSGSELVKIIDNSIWGGRGNGITLGSDLDLKELQKVPIEEEKTYELNRSDEFVIVKVVLDEFNGKEVEALVIVEDKKGDTHKILSEIGVETYFNIPFGRCLLTIGSEEYQLKDGKITGEELDNTIEITLVVTQASEKYDFSHLLEFIYDISISGNKITNMGVSGIGTPQWNLAKLYVLLDENPGLLKNHPMINMLVRQFGVVGGFVVDCCIEKNHISKCLQNVFGPQMRALTFLRGEGGISLGLCENISIRENRIEENGHHHGDPVCGVYISYASQADISHNHISDNGDLDIKEAGTILTPGIRGGVVLRLTVPLMIAEMVEEGNFLAAVGGFAARIHDNVILQPVGQALTMLSLGAASVINNRFQVKFAYKPSQQYEHLRWIDRLAATILIVAFNIPGKLLQSLFGGPINFASNQTFLGMNATSFTSQTIYTPNDLAFVNNQSEVLTIPNANLGSNTLLWANTLRVSLSRFKEQDYDEKQVSLVTLSSKMNNTSDNQGDHCIIAAIKGSEERLFYLGNVSFHQKACNALNEDALKEVLKRIFKRDFSSWSIRYANL